MRKSDFSEIRNFHFQYKKFLKLHFVKKVQISEDFWLKQKKNLHIHWYLYFMKQVSFHPYISPNWSKNKKLEWSHYIGISKSK